MKEEDCKGCYTYEQFKKNPKRNNTVCKWFNELLVCPCMACLVKPICDKACNELIKYEDDLDYYEKLGKENGVVKS